MQAEAAKAGGRVVVTLGNHEAEFLADPLNKKAADFIKEMKTSGLKPEDVAAGKDALGIGEWLRSLPAAARVNDWFFAHAGNTHNRTLPKLREDLQGGHRPERLQGRRAARSQFAAPGANASASLVGDEGR